MTLKQSQNRRYSRFKDRLLPNGGDDVVALDCSNATARIISDIGGGGTATHDATLEGDCGIDNCHGGRATRCSSGGNGYIKIADHVDLSFGDGSTDSPFSIEMILSAKTMSDLQLVAKGVYNSTGEYRLFTDSNDRLFWRLFDESVASCYIGRGHTVVGALTGLQNNSIVHVVATYDGSGTSSGLKFYVNGVRGDDADSDSNPGSYVAMENLAADLQLGLYSTTHSDQNVNSFRLIDRELTAAEVAQLAYPWNHKPSYIENFDNLVVAGGAIGSGVVKGTDLEVVSGTVLAEEDSDGKYIRGSTNAVVAMPCKASSGSWEWAFKYGNNSIAFSYMAGVKDAYNAIGQTGYSLFVLFNGTAATVFRNNGASPVALASDSSLGLGASDLLTMRVTRTGEGKSYVYVKGSGWGSDWILMPADTGANPFTDATYNVCKYVTFTLLAPARLYGFRSYNGENSPL